MNTAEHDLMAVHPLQPNNAPSRKQPPLPRVEPSNVEDGASEDAGARAKVVQRRYEAFQTGDMDTLRSCLPATSPGIRRLRARAKWHGADSF
jgi:hypothetical protein